MYVTIIAPGCKVLLPSGAEQNFPVGWTGPVPRAAGERWVAEGKANEQANAAPVELTNEEAAVLKVAAGQIIDQQRNQLAALEFAEMTVADLKLIAGELQMPVERGARKDDIVAALEAKRDEILGDGWRNAKSEDADGGDA